jgi:hypothetical protein
VTMMSDDAVSRRCVLTMAAATAASVVLSSWPLPASAASLPQESLPLRVCLPPFGPSPSRVNWCLRIFEKAAAQYEATGETEDLQRARWTLYWKLGYVMAGIPRRPGETVEQIRGFQLLEIVAKAYPEIPWQVNLAKRLGLYRAWGCDKGRTWDSVGII